MVTTTFATAEEAAIELDRLISGTPRRIVPTLWAYMESLIEEGGEYDDKYESETTVNLHETVWSLYVCKSALGDKLLTEIERKDVQRWVNHLYRHLAPSTVRRYGTVVHTALTHAVEDGWLKENPARSAKPGQSERSGIVYREIPDTPATIYKPAQLRQIPELLYAYRPVLSALVTVMVDAGLRPGEVAALKWRNIGEDPDYGWIAIIAESRRRSGKDKATKTKRIRPVPLTADAIAAIQEQPKMKDHVFLNSQSKPWNPLEITRALRRFTEKMNKDMEVPLPKLLPRDMRKTFVTRGVRSADLKTVQITAGHSSPEITQQVYAQTDLSAQRRMVDTMAEKLGNRAIFGRKAANRAANEEASSTLEAG